MVGRQTDICKLSAWERFLKTAQDKTHSGTNGEEREGGSQGSMWSDSAPPPMCGLTSGHVSGPQIYNCTWKGLGQAITNDPLP